MNPRGWRHLNDWRDGLEGQTEEYRDSCGTGPRTAQWWGGGGNAYHVSGGGWDLSDAAMHWGSGVDEVEHGCTWFDHQAVKDASLCATPGCTFFRNSVAEFGGYCCKACPSSGAAAHGPRCSSRTACSPSPMHWLEAMFFLTFILTFILTFG